MRFRSLQEVQHFLVEIERLDLVSSAKEDFKPDEEMIELFIKRRNDLVPSLKDFRRSQMMKQQWRHNRYALLKGIRGFHKSTQGKRFHRELGRFIATRDVFSSGGLVRQLRNNESKDFIFDTLEHLKAINSLKQHLYIYMQNYMSVEEQVEFLIFYEIFSDSLNRLEENLMNNEKPCLDEDLDILMAVVNCKYYISPFCENSSFNFDELNENYNNILQTQSENSLPYVSSMRQLLSEI